MKPTKGICVDCSVINGNPGNGEFRGLSIETGKVLFEHKIDEITTNNIAEFLALVLGVKWLLENNIEGKVYSDSQTALAWYKHKRHKSNLFLNEQTKYSLEALDKGMALIPNYNHMNYVDFWRNREWGEIPADYNRKK